MSTSSSSRGVGAGLRTLVAHVLQLVQTRLELLGVELQEEKLRLARLFIFAFLAAISAAFALFFIAVFIIVLVGEDHRLLAVGAIAVAFSGISLVAASFALTAIREGSQLFAASLAELRHDREQLNDSLNHER